MLINRYTDPCLGKYLLLSNIGGLRNAYALTKAFLSCMIIVISLLGPLRVGLV